MRVIALHGAGEGFLAASVIESGECSTMLKFPRGERVSEQVFDHEQKALHGAGEAFSCYFVP